jgi:hypothetical protein
MIDLTSAGMFAGFGAIGLMWSQVKQFLSRVTSLLIVSVELNGQAETAFMAYAWNNMRCSRFGDRRFTSGDIFIRPKDRQGIIGFEMVGKSVTFFHGIKPIFVAATQNKNDEFNGSVKISFFRGTFDIEKLVADSMSQFDESHHSTSSNKKRYHIRKFFGSKPVQSNGIASPKGEAPAEGEKAISDATRAEFRPVGWDRKDLGAPIADVPFKNLSYAPHVKEFQAEIGRWKNSEKWFKEKGLSWRMGAGIFGPPGTGKTSFVRAVGQDLDMPIHVYDLTTMDNEELCRFWANSLAQAPCIVLFEDIDRIFDKDKSIKQSKGKSLTLDCLLNCIAGVEQANGILVFVTANDLSKIDPALGIPDQDGKSTRPGRLDAGIYFGPLLAADREAVANRILSDYPEFIDKIVKDGDGETGAQFEARCMKLALKTFWGKPKLFVQEEFDISKSTRAELLGTSKTMDELRREDATG